MGQPEAEGGHVELAGVTVGPQAEMEHLPSTGYSTRVQQGTGDAPDEIGLEPLVTRRDRGMDGEDGIALDVGPRVVEQAPVDDELARALREQERRVALVEMPDPGRELEPRRARTPPMPSTSSWCSRISRPRTYRMWVIGRSSTALSRTSVSSRRTGTRPTWASHTAADRSRPGSGTFDGERLPSRSSRPTGATRELVVGVRVLLVAVRVDGLAEVALAVQEADADQRQRHIQADFM